MKIGLRILFGKFAGPICRWNGKIKIAGELGRRKVDWIELARVKASGEALCKGSRKYRFHERVEFLGIL